MDVVSCPLAKVEDGNPGKRFQEIYEQGTISLIHVLPGESYDPGIEDLEEICSSVDLDLRMEGKKFEEILTE
jgi:hypothetical protein